VIVLVSCCSIVLLASSYFYWLSADSFLLETADGTGDCKSEIYYCLYLFSLTVPAVRKSGAQHGRFKLQYVLISKFFFLYVPVYTSSIFNLQSSILILTFLILKWKSTVHFTRVEFSCCVLCCVCAGWMSFCLFCTWIFCKATVA